MRETFNSKLYMRANQPGISSPAPRSNKTQVLVDCLQEWVPAKAVTRFLSFLKGPNKAAQAFGLTPNRYSVRLNDFLQLSLGEGKKEDDAGQKWSDAGLFLLVSCPWVFKIYFSLLLVSPYSPSLLLPLSCCVSEGK